MFSEYKAEIDNISRENWDSILSRFDCLNIFQTFEYGERSWGRKNLINPHKYADVQKTVPESNKMRIILCCFNGQYVAGSILSALGNSGKSLLAATGTLDIEQKLSSSYLMDWHAMKWLRQNRFKYLDLHGYHPESYPGPSHCKAGFGGDDVRFVGPYEACHNFFSKQIIQLGRKIDSYQDKMKAISLNILNIILKNYYFENYFK